MHCDVATFMTNNCEQTLGYFNQFGSTEFEHITSIAPIVDAHIYHYHRPHLEEKLLPNSVCTVHHDLDDPDPWHAKF